MHNLKSIWHRWGAGVAYTGVWWAVAYAWRFEIDWVGWLGLGLYLGLMVRADSSRFRLWIGSALIALIGFASDLAHAHYGFIPPIRGWNLALIFGLWVAFGRLIFSGVFSSIPFWVAPWIGAVGGWLNYNGLAAWMGFLPQPALYWIALEWAVLFPVFLKLSHCNRFQGGKKSQQTVKSST